jgi:hypothetical protein
MKETLEKQKGKTISLYIPSEAIDGIDHECLVQGLNRSQFILSLWENQNAQSPGGQNEPSGPDLSGFKMEMIESLRAEIRAGLTVPAISPPPDLSPVLDAIGDLSRRLEERESASAPSGDPSPLAPQLEEILALLRTPRSSGETESEAHALSFLSLQMGELQQGIERLSVQMDGVVRVGKNNGAGTSPEIKDELIRLAEAAEHQSALTGEILRIGDTVREIRERLQKNPTTGVSPIEKIPEKVSRKAARPEELDPAAEKKAETRQWGWAVGIILVLFFGFISWEMLGWYNGGDSVGLQDHPPPAKPPESPLLPGPKQSH